MYKCKTDICERETDIYGLISREEWWRGSVK